jgi:hypothetical protein
MLVMRTMIRQLALGLSLVVMASLSFGDPLNERPAFDATILSDLDDAFDDIATDGDYDIDIVEDQVGAAWFSATSNGLANASLVLKGMPYGDDDDGPINLPEGFKFGLYKAGDMTNQLVIFDTDNSDLDDEYQVSLQFKSGDAKAYVPGDAAHSEAEDFGTVFGFFLTFNLPEIGETTLWSEDSKNKDDRVHFLAYASNGDETVDLGIPGIAPGPDPAHYYTAWEAGDHAIQSNFFTDWTVQFESITPVPEPATMAFVLAGAAGAVIRRRRKKNAA